MGESYGGVYVPTLTARIVDGLKTFKINLKVRYNSVRYDTIRGWNRLQGMALGNGYVNEKLNIDTSVRYAYGHGLIDEKTWNTLERDCCKGCIDSCDLTAVRNEEEERKKEGYHCRLLVTVLRWWKISSNSFGEEDSILMICIETVKPVPI